MACHYTLTIIPPQSYLISWIQPYTPAYTNPGDKTESFLYRTSVSLLKHLMRIRNSRIRTNFQPPLTSRLKILILILTVHLYTTIMCSQLYLHNSKQLKFNLDPQQGNDPLVSQSPRSPNLRSPLQLGNILLSL